MTPSGDARPVDNACRFGRFHDHLQTRFDITRWGKTTFIANQGRIATKLFLDDLFQIVKDFTTNNHGLGKVGGARGNDKKLLKGEAIAGMFSTVNDIKALCDDTRVKI